MTRAASPTALALGSAVLMAGLVFALWWREREFAATPDSRPLVVYAAPTSRLPLEASAADYERATGRRVELRFGASEDILTKVRFPDPAAPADLFIPADDSYVKQARGLGLAAESFPVAEVRAVLLLARGNPGGISGWPDLLRPGVTVAVPNPAAAVGKLARDHLARSGRWSSLALRVVDVGTVTEAANAARVGSADAAVVWDAVAAGPGYRGQEVLAVPELDGVTARVEVAVLVQSRDPAAARAFAAYLTAPDRGLAHFRAAGFRVAALPDSPGAKP